MKAFGLPDARVPATLAPEEAVVVLNGFNMYRIADQPIIEDGQTVSFDDDSSYSTHWTEDDRYETDHAFYNPFGMLWVEPVQHGIWGRMKGMLKN
nr:DUF4261 domain-containing protein [Ectobacillus ponti]